MTAALQVRELTVTFPGRRGEPGVTALQDLSFSLGAGESLSVIGESGSGKTTLLRAVLGHLRPERGTVRLFGVDLAEASKDELTALRRRCAAISQDPYGSLPPTLTVLESVLEPWLLVHGRGSRAEGEERARSLLAELGMGDADLLRSRVRLSLSGGQRQRAAIARALVLEPELLLCDEPTSMQDASTRGEILRILLKRRERGMAMVFVTHDLFLARRAAPQGFVLHRGRMVEQGSTSDLLAAPKDPYTRALVAALPRLGVH